jgi:UDP-glucuronate 4-epimerase
VNSQPAQRTALVSGAAGFIGSHLTEQLLAGGISVIGIDRLSDYYDPERKRDNLRDASGDMRFTFLEGDLRELATPSLLDGVDVVYHLAGQPGVRPSWGQSFQTYIDDNVAASQALLEAAKEVSLERFVYASSSSIYGNAERFPTLETDTPHPISPYGVTKLAAEHLCNLYWHAFGVPTVSLRYFSVYGPRQRPDMAFDRFIRACMEGGTIRVFGDGRQSRDFTYVMDVVAATRSAAERGRPGEAYNIAGGSRTTVLEVIEILERLLDVRLDVQHEERARGDALDTFADTSKAAGDLAYSPQFDLASGLAAQARSAMNRRSAV